MQESRSRLLIFVFRMWILSLPSMKQRTPSSRSWIIVPQCSAIGFIMTASVFVFMFCFCFSVFRSAFVALHVWSKSKVFHFVHTFFHLFSLEWRKSSIHAGSRAKDFSDFSAACLAVHRVPSPKCTCGNPSFAGKALHCDKRHIGSNRPRRVVAVRVRTKINRGTSGM